MNKTAIKNFAVWARNKLIADITYKAGLIGVSEKGIAQPLPQSSKDLQFFDIGTKDYVKVVGSDIAQRNALVRAIQEKESGSDYKIAFKSVVEEVAYTWFNRLIAIRFMEVNDYLPSRIRVLSSENSAKSEPDFVTNPFDTDMEFTMSEQDKIMRLKDENKLDELFRMLFIKQCNKLHEVLPKLFEETNDYTELLLTISFTDRDGILYHLVHDIDEDDFNIEKGGQVEIIGWMYQYYNTEPKDEAFALLKKNVKITKERIPAATQLFTPDWIVRYMVENSLGRLWIEGHPNEELKDNWKYYLEEAEQDADVQAQMEKIRAEYRKSNPEDIKVIDPCMGSGHILVYCFDVLMQIYESQGYTQRDAAQSILENNLFGLDIDDRAFQLAYFAVMMKARQYNRRILNGKTDCKVYSIQESNNINRNHLKYFGVELSELEKNKAQKQIVRLLEIFTNAKEYGSILNIECFDWDILYHYVAKSSVDGQMTLDAIGLEKTQEQLELVVEIAETMARKYDVVVTNPPYMSNRGMSDKLLGYVKENFAQSKSDMFAVFVEKSRMMCKLHSFYAMITQPSILFLSSFDTLRSSIASTQAIETVLHMGRGIFGIDFGSAAFVIRNSVVPEYRGGYFRLHERTFQYIEPYDIEKIYLSALSDPEFTFNFSTYSTDVSEGDNIEEASNKELRIYFATRQENFLRLPGCPYAYWVSDKIIETFNEKKIGDVSNPRQGMATGENNRFLRMWQEVSIDKCGFGYSNREEALKSNKKWFPYNKGGDFRKWYGNNEYMVNWENDGFEICHFTDAKGKLRSRPQNAQFYFKQSLTWSFVSSTSFGVRYSPEGALFDIGGSSVFPQREDAFYLLGLLCSNISFEYMKLQNPTMNFQVGNVANIPVIISRKDRPRIECLVRENISFSKSDWDSYETSWDFLHHPLACRGSVSEAFGVWKKECADRFNHLKANEEELNRIFIEVYGLEDELTPEVDDKNITVCKADLKSDVKNLISYAVGCMLGRYSLDEDGLAYAGGEWDSSKYSTFIPDKDNCIPITDEPYFEDDMLGLFCTWLKKVYGEDTLEENLDFIAKALDNKGSTSREVIRNYFLNDFIKNHIKTYQKRPIYWLFDSGKQNGFKALVYMHRWNADTVGNLRVEYLHKMQHTYEREIIRMQETIDNSRDSREVSKATKRKDKLQKQLKETKDYDAKLAHIALSRIDIDLDDGVKVNYEKVQTGRDGKKMQILAKI